MPKKDKAEISPTKTSSFVGYEDFLSELKTRIANSQLRAAVAVNKELTLLYWYIGREILTRQQQQGWGAKVIDRLAADLKKAFPEMKGFSSRNLTPVPSKGESGKLFSYFQIQIQSSFQRLLLTKSRKYFLIVINC